MYLYLPNFTLISSENIVYLPDDVFYIMFLMMIFFQIVAY